MKKSIRDSFLKQLLKEEAWNACFQFNWLKHDLSIPVKKYKSISICTTCMGRLHDIEATFIKNIKDNINYPKIEFVLLDYGSLDGLNKWARNNLPHYIEKGIVNYYRMIQPSIPHYYSMTHSRNLAFKLAQGEIVNNVDADHYTGYEFAYAINQIANQFPTKIVFAKSKQKNRGRLGFYRKEFIKNLGGYDENIKGYGWDDKDLMYRATKQGFHVVTYGGQFCRLTNDHQRHPTDNYKTMDWKGTQRLNTTISLFNILAGRLKANQGQRWGDGWVEKNFNDQVAISVGDIKV